MQPTRSLSMELLDSSRLMRISVGCILLYVTIYSLESPIRYLLYLTGANAVILTRDLLVDIPAALLVFSQSQRGKLDGAVQIFIALAAIQSLVFLINLGSLWTTVFGLKLLIPSILGLIVGKAIITPQKWTARIFAILLVVVTISVIAEKYFVNYPWIGIHVYIGDYDIEISRDWQVEDAAQKRVGGFTHSSISAANLLPVLMLIVVTNFRSIFFRILFSLTVLFAVFLTTQKGAFIALLLVSSAWCLPRGLRRLCLPTLVVLGVIADFAIPIYFSGMQIGMGSNGVFSADSFVDRIEHTWPSSFDWISNNSVFPFGVGIGGMGAPLKDIAPGIWQFPDNMAIFLYANFGLFVIILYGGMIYGAIRSLYSSTASDAALAVLAFLLFYGVVISIIEDQMGALFIGAAIGTLLTIKITDTGAVTVRKHNRSRRSQPGSQILDSPLS